MKKRVLLVDPPGPRPEGLNTGLGWLAANVVEAAEVSVLGLGNIFCDRARAIALLKTRIKRDAPTMVGFNIHCTTYRVVLDLIATLRQYYTGTVIIGGPHTAYEQEKILADSPGTDLVLMGEAERTLPELLRRAPGDYRGIPGIIYRRDGAVMCEPVAGAADFAGLRHPDYRQFGVTRIYNPYPLSTSRGCPYHCCFCNPYMGGRWRSRSWESVFDELTFARREFGITSFRLSEPVFNITAERIIEFCDELQRREINLPWSSSSGLRADGLTPASVAALRRAGCTEVKIGVETLVPEIFEHVNKGESLDDIYRAAEIVKGAGLPLWGSFILGLPYDTASTARRNFELSQQLRFDFTAWSLLVPYPGTPAYQWYREHGTIYHDLGTAHQGAGDAARARTVQVACDTPAFPRAERAELFREIAWKTGNYFYSLHDPDWKKAVTIISGLLRYDPWHVPGHLANLVRLARLKRVRTSPAGVMFDFAPDVFPSGQVE